MEKHVGIVWQSLSLSNQTTKMKLVFILLIITLSACTPDPETERALEVSREIKRLNDELDQKIEKAEKIIEENKESTYKSEGFNTIEPINDFGDSAVVTEDCVYGVNSGDSIDLQVIISAYDSAEVSRKEK